MELERGNWLDRFALWLSPQWGAGRLASRTALKALYEGADTGRLRGHDWNVSQISTDAGIEQNLDKLRERSLDLYRNDALVHGLIESRVTSIVGKGYRPQSMVDHAEVGSGEEAARELDAALEKSFARWAPYSDPAGTIDFDEQLRQIWRSIDLLGDAFVEFGNARAPGKTMPLAVQVWPATMVETPPSQISNPLVRMGIEYDAKGRRIAYHLRHNEPGDNKEFSERHRRVPAFFSNGNPRVVHLFVQQFPRQSRGLPLVSAVLGKLKDIKDVSEAAIVREQIITCFAAIVRGTGSSLTRAEGGADATDSDGRLIQNMSPGQVLHVGNDTEVDFANPNTPASNFEPFINQQRLEVSAGVQWPASWLTNDYRNFNYSAGRLESIAGVQTIRVAQQLLMGRLLRHLWAQVWEQARFTGVVDVPETAFREHRAAYLEHRWIAPGRPYIDPAKEIDAAEKAIALNLTDKSTVAQQVFGVDWYDEVAPQRQREIKREAELEIAASEPAAPDANKQPDNEGAKDDDGE